MISIYLRKSVIKIQKNIRGYLLRKKLKIFTKLPWELWDRVLYYSRYQHNIQHSFKNSISRIYDKKIFSCDDDIVELHLHDPDEEYDVIFSLRIVAIRGYYILIKNDVMNMFRKYSLVIY